MEARIMKLVLISDIHSNYDALSAASKDMHDYDFLVCLGDLVGYGPQPNEVVQEIRQMNPQIIIAGNHDYATVTGDTSNFVAHASRAIEWTRRRLTPQNCSYLSRLPHHSTWSVDDFTIACFHGSPRDPLNEYVYPGVPDSVYQALIEETSANILILGHTHMPLYVSTASGTLINPGSIGQPRDGDPRASYAILEITNGKASCSIRRVRYDIKSTSKKIVQEELPTFLADRLFMGV
jgi:putative phosphoesterase